MTFRPTFLLTLHPFFIYTCAHWYNTSAVSNTLFQFSKATAISSISTIMSGLRDFRIDGRKKGILL
jgi:hypothetical protein